MVVSDNLHSRFWNVQGEIWVTLSLSGSNAINDSFGWGSFTPIDRMCNELTVASWHDKIVRGLTLVCLEASYQLWCANMDWSLDTDPL